MRTKKTKKFLRNQSRAKDIGNTLFADEGFLHGCEKLIDELFKL